VVPPSFGVDISPIVWIAVASLSRELLLGQQGVLVLMQTRG
jgi:YggT family protein